ncbi:MAG: AarF/ABC1/UbiB kinase family protein [archaeon]
MFNIPRRFAGIKRFERILEVLSRHGLDFLLEKMNLKKRSFSSRKSFGHPVELRLLFEELGGSFIKLGQLLSLRPDLIPKEYCDELAKLQDSVAPFSYEEVEHVIRAELKKPIAKIFRSFERKPIAAASIGQVHLARLKNGRKVAVKVMRPGIKALFENDLEILDFVARQFKHYLKPELFDPEEIFNEFKRYTENELDYLKEARNIRLFHDHAKGVKAICIPAVHDELTTPRVLVMDFVEGVELRRVLLEPGRYKGLDKRSLAETLVHSFMKQIFIDGLFHADPHPGNIVINRSVVGFIDFGIVGRIDDAMKEKLGRFLIGVIDKDVDSMVQAMISLDVVGSDVDANKLKHELVDELGEYYDVGLDRIDLAVVFFRCLAIARNNHMRLSSDFVLLGKALITLRSVCLQLSPGFNIIEEARPFIKKLLKEKTKPAFIFKRLVSESARFAEFVHELPDQSRRMFRVVDKADTALDDINHDLSALTSAIKTESWRIMMGIIVASLIIAASATRAVDESMSRLFVWAAGAILIYLLFWIARDHFRR